MKAGFSNAVLVRAVILQPKVTGSLTNWLCDFNCLTAPLGSVNGYLNE